MSEILFTAPLAYETGNPITPPSEKGSRFRVDLVDGRIYQWDSGPDVWRLFAQGLDPLPNTSAPVYIPGIGQSAFAITTDRKLYFYSGGAWNLIPVQGATGPAGPNGAVGPTGATGPQGAAGTTGQGVPTGGTADQVLSKIDATNYNTAWADDKNGIYSGSGTVPLSSRQLYVSPGYGAILKNLINDPLDAARAYDAILPFDANLTNWQTKTYEDFTAAALTAPVGAFVNDFEQGSQYFETRLAGNLLTSFDFTNGIYTDQRTSGSYPGQGLQYAADYSATVLANNRSIPDVGMVNLLKQNPVSYTSAAAPNNTIFYSTTLSKLCYKDPGGTVNPLY